MNKNKSLKHRDSIHHLYNPKEEGLGSYDAHYINAHKNKNLIRVKKMNETNERFAA